MKTKILATVSVIALLSAMPIMAVADNVQTDVNTEGSSTGNIIEDAKIAGETIKDASVVAYDEIKATLIGKDSTAANTPVTLDSRRTAAGIIGHNVYNEKHESIAKVSDIILDKNGKAIMVVVSDGAFIGLGKKAAFDYSAITRVETDGDVIMPLTEAMIDNAAIFSYNKAESGDKVRVTPDNGYSVSELLKGKLLNQNKESVADIENISFKNGKANQIIVGFDKTLGLMGGEKAVMDFDDAKIVRDGESLDFQLSTEKTAQFETYKAHKIKTQ